MAQPISHRIIFIRHAQSMYSNVYPDLTEEGIHRLKQTAKELLKQIPTPHRIIASPAVRAQGSAHILARELGYEDEILTEQHLSDMAYADWPAAKMIFERCRLECGGVENIYDTDARFEDASIFEPRSSVRRRFYTYLEELIHNLHESSDPQNIIIVSHFEVLNHFMQKFFPDASWLGAGKSFLVQFEHTTDEGDSKALISYGNFSKQVSLSDIFAGGSKPSLVFGNDRLNALMYIFCSVN